MKSSVQLNVEIGRGQEGPVQIAPAEPEESEGGCALGASCAASLHVRCTTQPLSSIVFNGGKVCLWIRDLSGDL